MGNLSGNLSGILLMVVSMAFFAVEDSFVKLMLDDLQSGQIIALLGLGGGLVFAVLLRLRGEPLLVRAALSRPVLIRNGGEILGGVGYVTSLALIPLSSATAILQVTPLVVTMGAALFLRERVGPRRWAAIVIGLIGVMVIIRPGMDTFQPGALFAVVAVVGLAMRDVATRLILPSVTNLQISFYAYISFCLFGLVLMLVQGTGAMTPRLWLLLLGGIGSGVLAYYALTNSTRLGELSAVIPFRYSRLLFGLALGITVFAERPDRLTLLGSGIILVSGIYTMWREQVLHRNTR